MKKVIAFVFSLMLFMVPTVASAGTVEEKGAVDNFQGLLDHGASIIPCMGGHAKDVVAYYKEIPAAFDAAFTGKSVLQGIIDGVVFAPLDIVFTTAGHAVGVPVCVVPESIRDVVLAPTK